MADGGNLQEPLQPGMFEGSVTFLSAEIDPDGSEMAALAISQGKIEGPNMVLGHFATRHPAIR